MKRIILLSVAVLLIFSSCSRKNFYTIQGEAHGTTYSVIFEGDKNTLQKSEIDSLTSAFDNSLSTYQENSKISQLNRSEKGMPVDSLFIKMYGTAVEVWKMSDGAFDITVAPLVNIYGFGYGDKADKIDSTLTDSILSYVGMKKIRLENGFLHKSHPRIEIDGNAIAKGLSVDNTAEYLNRKGIKNYLVEIGGEVVAKGKKGDREWIVGIDRPEEGNFEPGAYLEAKVKISDKALATSGNYRRFYEQDGKKYVHTINPKTGQTMMSDLLSVTVIAPDCVTADAYATACMAMGHDRAKTMIEKLPDIEAFFILSDDKGNFITDMTTGMKQYIQE